MQEVVTVYVLRARIFNFACEIGFIDCQSGKYDVYSVGLYILSEWSLRLNSSDATHRLPVPSGVRGDKTF